MHATMNIKCCNVMFLKILLSTKLIFMHLLVEIVGTENNIYVLGTHKRNCTKMY